VTTDAAVATIASRVLDMVGGRAEAAVTVARVREGLTRFANSFIHQNVVDEHVEVALQVSADGRPAAASTFATSDDALRGLVDRTLSAARLRPVDPAWPGLAPPSALLETGDAHYDEATASATSADRAERVAAFVAAGTPHGLQGAGFCETAYAERAFANSLGQRLEFRTTHAGIDGILRSGGIDGVGASYSVRFADLDAAAVGRQAADRARKAIDPIELPPGRYEVVLDRRCTAALVEFLAFYGFNGRAVAEDRSFVKVGETQLDRRISIWDDATDPRQYGDAFDAEGTPKRRVSLVEAGVVTGVTHDRLTAARAGEGTETTGHALPGGESFGAVATSAFLGPADPADTESAASLVSQVERGLLLSDFWYIRVLDPKTLVATGLTRNGLWLIENGQVGPSVSNLRFTQSFVAALAPDTVLGIGDDGGLAYGDFHLLPSYVPSLRLASWNFTGNAST
jgi:predicted Zn-dependent protease